MDAYVDSSGDEGFKFGKSKNPTSPEYGSSRYYTVVALLIVDATELAARITELRGQLGMAEDEEFHFSEMKNYQIWSFLAMLDCYDFEIHALIVPKAKLWSPRLRNDGEWFHRFFCSKLLCTGATPLSNSRVVIDTLSSDLPGQQEDRAYLLAQVNQGCSPGRPRVRDLSFRDSHLEPMVQAADMCAGAIRRAYEHKKAEYRRLIEDRIVDEWIFASEEDKIKPWC